MPPAKAPTAKTSTSRPEAGQIFAALGDPTRRAIVERLSCRPRTVSELAAPLQISLTAVAQHLDHLANCGLVETEKIGRVRTVRLAPAGFAPLEAWLSARRQEWSSRLHRLEHLLDTPPSP